MLKSFSSILFFLVTICYGQTEKREFKQFFFDEDKKIVSSEGYMKNGIPDGYWKNYYVNGILKSEGRRKNTLLDSNWKFYDENGILKSEIYYKEDKKNGISRVYDKTGNLTKQETFVDNKKDGWTIFYDEFKRVKKQIFYSKGKENKTAYSFDNDGNVIEIIKYDDGVFKTIERINKKNKTGKKEGVWREYYDYELPLFKNLNVKLAGKYINGLKHGYFREYDKKGQLIETTKYRNGEIEKEASELTLLDIEKEYYGDAKVKKVKSYKDGKPEGAWREYDKDGTIVGGELYEKGIKKGNGIIDEEGIKQGDWVEYYKNGKVRSKGRYKNGLRIDNWKFYYKNGKLEQEGKYLSKERPHGLWKWYYEDGSKWREENFERGVEEGLLIEWNDSQKVVTKGEFIEGLKEGKWYYNIGDHTEEGDYIAGNKEGEWKHFYENNQLNYIGSYVDGSPVGKHIYYYKNGRKMLEGKYEYGKKEKEWRRYNEEGNLVLSIIYKDGVEKKLDGVKIKPKEEN